MSNCISCGRYLPEGYGWACPECSEGECTNIIAIDPGESIGITYRDVHGKLWGLTLTGERRLQDLWRLLTSCGFSRIIYEEFALRQSAAKKLIGNKFITCEVIGVIKLYAQIANSKIISLHPGDKEYCGFSSNPKDPHFREISMWPNQKITEHTRDAYRLLRYAELFKLKEKTR